MTNIEIINYIDKNWLSIREEWVLCFKTKVNNLGENTTNRVESFFGHFKSVADRHQSVADMLAGLLNHIIFLRREKKHNFLKNYQKVPTNKTLHSDLLPYYEICTSYAFSLIEQQFNLVSEFYDKATFTSNSVFYFGKSYTVYEDKCTCSFYSSIQLPCKHMFAIASKNNISNFFPNSINDRFKNDVYREQHCNAGTLEFDSVINDVLTHHKSSDPLNSNQKYKIVSSKFNVIANNLITLGRSEFNYYVSIIDELSDFIKDKKKLLLCEVIESSVAAPTVAHAPPPLPPLSSQIIHSGPSVPAPPSPPPPISTQNSGPTTPPPPSPSSPPSIQNQTNHSDLPPSSPSPPKLHMPTPKRPRGRPRGTETTTVVGALKRKGKMCIFEQKTLSKKKKLIFESILNKEAFLKFKNEGKNIFSKDNLKKTLPSKLMDQIFFENVKIFKDHFTFDTFDFIEKFHFNKKIKWKCTSCLTNLENKNSVGCDGCFDWHHLECAFLSAPPKENFWFCEKCNELNTNG